MGNAYIPEITQPEAIYTIHIRRFDPDTDLKPHWESYQIPFVRTMTVMEALEYLQDQGEYIAFRANCREFTCGSCAMTINGKPGLACVTLLKDHMRIEPLQGFPLKKDLIVDTTRIEERFKQLELWPHHEDNILQQYKISLKVQEDWHNIFSRCIECYSCLEACPQSDLYSTHFIGPMWMIQIARSQAHPLERFDRLSQAAQNGIWSCVNCYECAEVCPVGLKPVEVINRLRVQILWGKAKQLLPSGKVAQL